MWDKVLQLLSVRCRHRHLSKPFALNSATSQDSSDARWERANPRAEHYVVCLDCGKRFAYDWNAMRLVR